MQWNLDFISARDFQEHVKHTIESYGEKLRPIDLKRFNANIIAVSYTHLTLPTICSV